MRSEQSYYTTGTLAAQTHRQVATYWRVRLSKLLEQFETEVRRMLTLEAALDEFSQNFCAAAGPTLEKLMEQGWTLPAAVAYAQLPKEAIDWAELEVGKSRSSELKSRYRTLVKEVHPDSRTREELPVSMDELMEAYQRADLARLMRLEAEMLVPDLEASAELEDYARQLDAATQTYKKAYSDLLHAPVYQLYSRANCSRTEGWDWLEMVVTRAKKLVAQGEIAAA